MTVRTPGHLTLFATVFVFAVALNFPWEMVQAYLFVPMGSLSAATWRCFVASLGDGVMIFAILAAGRLAFGTWTWFAQPGASRMLFMLGAALVLGVAIEFWGLETGRWAYRASMPLVPMTHLGAVPLAQLPTLTPLILAASCRLLGITVRKY